MQQFKRKLFLLYKRPSYGLVFLLLFLLNPPFLSAAMVSENYVIYDNAMHVFDGPIISGISHSVSEQTATVTWNTDQISDAFVEYDTDSGFSNSKEQGSTLQNSLSHSVSVSGLESETTYYYRVKSRRLNGGVTVETPVANTFTTEALPAPEPETTTTSGGGGLLIIDKTDKIPPVISEVEVQILQDGEVQISWITDEDATSFVEYGLTEDYGATYGHWNMTANHSVLLRNLQADRQYNFRALSSDDWGNVGYSENFIFSIEAGAIEDPEVIPEEPEEGPGTVETTIENLLDFIRRIFPEVSLNNTEPNPLADVNSLDDLRNLAPIPVLSGEPRVEIGAEQVTVYWVSDIESDSRIALAPEDAYRPETGEPYRQVIGTSDVFSLNHEVTLYNLTPDTTYHFQLRSRPQFGPEARSRDFTFRTSLEELSISSFFYQVLDEQTAVFKWVTNKNSDSAITFTPYLGDRLATELMKTVRKNEETVIHEIEISEFMGGVKYNVTIASADDRGNRTTETFPDFSTSPDDSPPIVSHIKADSTVFLDRNNKTQTIISWRTNEPATSRIYFQEGVHGVATDLDESTELNENYTKEHVVVITKFRPGVVYTFRVESTDSGGNTVLSKPHTFMTAKTKESIFQIIMNILENTFGWMKKIM